MPITPCYVIVRDLVTWTKQTIEQLRRFPDVEPIIVDNASTYQPLLEWYQTDPCRVIRLTKNLGSIAPWAANIIPKTATQYLVTDPDLDLSQVPLDVVDRLRFALDTHQHLIKVGVSLEIQDIPATALVGKQAVNWETKFWKTELDAYCYAADVDTTFAMYRTEAQTRRTNPAARLKRPYTAKHLPWYFEQLSPEYQYYLNNIFMEQTPQLSGGCWSRLFRNWLPRAAVSLQIQGINNHDKDVDPLTQETKKFLGNVSDTWEARLRFIGNNGHGKPVGWCDIYRNGQKAGTMACQYHMDTVKILDVLEAPATPLAPPLIDPPLSAGPKQPFCKTIQDPLRIVAILQLQAVTPHLKATLSYLTSAGIFLAVVDNSGDKTVAEICEPYRHYIAHYEKNANVDFADFAKQLETIKKICHQVPADWFLNIQVDEIFQSPRFSESLRQGIERISAAGHTVIDFDEFVFVPRSDTATCLDFYKSLQDYYFYDNHPNGLRRAWRNIDEGRQWLLKFAPDGNPIGVGTQLAPEKFILRRYPYLSVEHAKQARSAIAGELRLPAPEKLKRLENPDDRNFQRDDPWQQHYW